MSGPREGFVVELVGLAGCGKSTLGHRAAQLLREAGAEVCEPSFELAHRNNKAQRIAGKLGYATRDALCRPRAARTAASAALATRQTSAADALSTVFNLLCVRGLLGALAQRPGIHLLDQGFYGALWSVAFRARAAGDPIALASQLARDLPHPPADLVVFVETAPEIALARARARALAPSGGRSRLERDGALADAARALEAVRKVVRGSPVASLRNDAPEPEPAARILADLVAQAHREYRQQHPEGR